MGQIVKVYKDGIGYQVLNTDNIGAALEAGDNISIDGNEISAVDTKYAAGTGLSLSGTTFSLNVDYGADLSLSIDPSTFVLTAQLKNQNGGNIGSPQTIDLPLESVVVSGRYNAQTKEVELTLQSGSVIRFSVADLVSGLQEELVVGNGINIDANNEISVDTSVIATKEYVDDSIAESIYSGSTAPLNPTQGMLRYDTVNDVLKSYDGTQWNEVGNESTDINTKAFYLSGTSDLTNAQAAYDWFSAGKNPIVMYNNRAYLLYEKGATQLIFQDIENLAYDQSSYTEYVGQKIIFTLSGNNVTAINYDNTSGWSGPILRTDVNYSTPYTPTYAGSPTTKQYVDNNNTYIGTSAPTDNVVEGRLWYDTTNDVLKVYDGTNWNEVGGDTYTAGTGISIDSNNEISADTSVIATKQYVDDSIAESVSSGATAPSNPTEGQIWYDTTNDVLKVYDGTNWNEIGSDAYTAGTGIDITNDVISADTTTLATKSDLDEKQDLLAAGNNITIQNECVAEDNKKGPCPSGFHVPTYNECTNLINTGITIGAWASGGGDSFKTKMKMPYSGYRSGPNSANIVNRNYMGFIWTCDGYTIGDPRSAYCLLIGSSNLRTSGNYRQDLLNIRPFKNEGVAPDSSWTTIYDGSSTAQGAGIFHNAELGLISISTDGTTWTTIADKNLGATTVYNDGDTLSEANCGKYYQWGNNYGFQWGGDITNVSSTPIDGSSYGPNNYYYNETLVRDTTRTFYDWSTVRNDNVWGGTSQGTFQDCTLTISANDTTYTAGNNIDITNDVISAENVIRTDATNDTGFRIEDNGGNYIDANYGMIDIGYEGNNQTFNTTLTPGGGISSEMYVESAGGTAYERSQVQLTNTFISATFDYDNGGGDADILQEDYAFFGAPVGTNENKIAKLGDIKNVMSSGTTAPSNPTEGQLWYDTTNDVLKVYNGTNWIEVGAGTTYTAGTGINITNDVISADTTTLATRSDLDEKQNELTAGDNITIENICVDISDMQGPAPTGYHVPINSEWVTLCGILTSAFSMANNAATMGIYLKMPMAGRRGYPSSDVSNVGSYGYYWSSIADPNDYAYCLDFDSSSLSTNIGYLRAHGLSVRCFKNTSVTPDSSWTTLYDGSSVATDAGVFWDSTDGLISVSGDGQTWYTIQDKNLGATTVYNEGDTLTDANCGYFYQWGNNYGFPHSGTVTTSSTQVDASSYGPGNYYSSSTFIIGKYNWSSDRNNNLWGGVSQGSTQECNLTISAQVPDSAEWGNITGTLSDQTDLQNALNAKANVTDLNTKAFYLSSTSDLTTAQAAYDWYAAGKEPIIIRNGQAYLLMDRATNRLRFIGPKLADVNSGDTNITSLNGFLVNVSNGTVISITTQNSFGGNYLSTNFNYPTVYTPLYDGSPATKKYVDDNITSTKSTGATAPSNPTEGQLWYDTANDVLKVYDGTNWNVIGDGVQLAPNSPLTPKYRRYGTQAQYDALTQYYTDTPGDTVYHTI